jgi:hypothetical protein
MQHHPLFKSIGLLPTSTAKVSHFCLPCLNLNKLQNQAVLGPPHRPKTQHACNSAMGGQAKPLDTASASYSVETTITTTDDKTRLP